MVFTWPAQDPVRRTCRTRIGTSQKEADCTVALLVEDEDREGQGAVVVVLGPDGLPPAQAATIVGGAD